MKIEKILWCVLLGILIMGCSSDQQEAEINWYNYGDEITVSEIIPVAHAVQRIDEISGKTVVVEGVIKQVCQTRGCWMVVEDNGESIRVRFADYGFFVPWESAGKRVRMQGTLGTEIVSEERARHWAEEADDPDVKPEDIHGDQEIIQLMATAVSIEGGKPISDDQKAVIGDAGEHEPNH